MSEKNKKLKTLWGKIGLKELRNAPSHISHESDDDTLAKKPTGFFSSLIVSCLAAILFVIFASTAIDGQGLYYDEVHQAPAAFVLQGKPAYILTFLTWGSIPLLTMSYSSAIKSVIYGLWMKITGLPFTITSWRFLGILLVAIGLFVFCFVTAKELGLFGLGIFFFLFLTDGTVLLTSRHDWGPTALALMLRLIWIGVWVKTASCKSSATAGWLILGFIPAFSIYEKLNNVVFLGPLVLVVFLSGKGQLLKRMVTVTIGFIIGMIPLIIVNLILPGVSWLTYQHRKTLPPRPGESPTSFFDQFFALGNGQDVSSHILGVAPANWAHYVELSLLLLLVFAAGVFAVNAWRKENYDRILGIGLLSYFFIAALTRWGLPRTWVHHWVVGTPFQYLAIAMTATFLFRHRRPDSPWMLPSIPKPVAFRVVSVLLIAFALFRGYNLVCIEKNLVHRMASLKWDPSYTKIAEFAVKHQADASFIAADWGFATQIYSLSNGCFPVAEPIWTWGQTWGPKELRLYLSHRPGKPIYVLLSKLRGPIAPRVKNAILDEVYKIARGVQLPLEDELSNLKVVQVFKFGPPF